MRKTIKIFIASSIVEFANERMAIENFIRKISDNFEEQYDVKIKPILCENLDDAYSTVRKQEEYNDKIRQSELCFFIFFTKAGQYTQEEFEVARKAFEESGKPKIYTYFKIIKDGEGEQSLYDFMKKLDEVFGHYYGTFDHVDTIKLRILLSLKLREMDFLEIKSEDGKCVVDGKSVMSFDNVAEFQNNSNLANLQKELKEVEQKYYEMKPIYAKGGCDDTFYREYCKVASRRQDLIDEIEQLQKAIFNMSMRMSADETYGEVTPRQKEAYRLFELGDYEGCMAVLDAEELKNDYLRQIKMLEEQKATVCRKFIRENKTAIDILMTMTDYQGRFDEIVRRYEDIVPIALAEGIELNVVYDYVYYLWQQNNHTRAIEIGEKLNNSSIWNDEKDDSENAKVYNLLGVLYDEISQPVKSEKFYLKSIEIREKLVKENPEKNSNDLVGSYNNIGILYENQGDYKKAEVCYFKAIEVGETFAKWKNESACPNLALSYSNTGAFCNRQGNYELAYAYILKAIEIYEVLAKENKNFNSDLAMSYNVAGVFYDDQDDYKKAEVCFLKAIEIYEVLAKENPQRFNHALASIYNRIGRFYKYQGNHKKADEYFLKLVKIWSILAKENPRKYYSHLSDFYYTEKFYEQKECKEAEEYFLIAIKKREALARENPGRFNPALAKSYFNVGVFYNDQGDYKQAENFFLKAMEIYETLAEGNSERFNLSLALSYNHMGSFYKKQDDYKKSEEYMLKAIEKREILANDNPEKFNAGLAGSYSDAGFFFNSQNNCKQAEKYYLKAIEIYETLAKENASRFISDLAMNYNFVGICYQKQGNHDKAEEYYLKAIDIYETLVRDNPEKFNPYLAGICYNFGLFSKEDKYLNKAIAIAKTCPDEPMCKMIIERLLKH